MRRRMFWNNTSAYEYGYLTFIALEDGTFSYSTASQYTIDDGKHWIDLPANTATPTIQAGNMISWRCEDNATRTFTSSNKFNAEGNVFSMKFGKNFKQVTSAYCESMFNGCTGLVSAENLIIPHNTQEYAYRYFFKNCTSLEKAPALPATSVAAYGYHSMFMGCKSLTEAPDLPATSIGSYCYYSMFKECTKLVIAPKIYATKLGRSACRCMFYGCKSLTTASDFSPSVLSEDCCMEMYRGCSSLLSTTPLTLPATTLKSQCYAYMFYQCTNLQNAPELPAIVLVNQCYANMFQQSGVTYVKCLATNINATDCTRSWLYGVPTTGTFIKHPDATWSRNNSGIPAGWTVEDAEI